MNIGKLSQTDVIDLATDLEENVYASRNAAFEDDEKLYEMDFKNLLHIPNEFSKDVLVLSTGRDMVDTFCNHTNISNASIKAIRKGDLLKTEEQANMEQHFAAGVMYITNNNSEVSPWWDCAKHYWLYGMGVLKPVYVTDADFPIRIMCVNPFNVYPDPDPYSMDFVIEINNYHYVKAKTRYPFWDNPLGRGVEDGDDMVRHISFWSKIQHMEIVDGQSVIKTKTGVDYHGYKCIPHVIFNSGLGMLSHDLDMSKRYVGMLRYVKDLLIAESSVFSVNHVVLKKAGWPGGIIQGDNSSMVRIEEGYGKWITLPEGVTISEYQHRTSPQEIMQEFSYLHSILAEHGAPRSMQGMGEEGVRSGSDRRLLLAEGATRLQQSIQTFQNRTNKVLENCATIFVNKVPDKVTVWSRDAAPSFVTKIDKSKMKEPFIFKTEFSPVSEEDNYRRHDDKIRLLSAGVYDRTKVWEEMEGLDSEDMAERIERQRIMDDPMLQQVLGQAYAQLAGAAINKAMGNDALTQQLISAGQQQEGAPQNEQPPMMMTQGVPNRAVPGSAQDIQNQIANRVGANPMRGQQGVGGGGERGANR